MSFWIVWFLIPTSTSKEMEKRRPRTSYCLCWIGQRRFYSADGHEEELAQKKFSNRNDCLPGLFEKRDEHVTRGLNQGIVLPYQMDFLVPKGTGSAVFWQHLKVSQEKDIFCWWSNNCQCWPQLKLFVCVENEAKRSQPGFLPWRRLALLQVHNIW